MSRALKLNSGDLLIGNWMTVLGRLTSLSGQRWGHIGFVVNIDGAPHAYEISSEGRNPIIIPMQEYLNNKTLIELTVRQLKVPFNVMQEEAFKQTLIKYEDTVYPSLGKVISRVSGGPLPKGRGRRDELLCSELVYSILQSMEWVPELRVVTGNRTILPDMFIPGVIANIDTMYSNELKLLYKKDHTQAEAAEILEPQLNLIGQLLLP